MNQLRASEQKIIQYKHEIDSGKSMESSLERSKSLCEAQMKALDKKYNGKINYSYSVVNVELIIFEHFRFNR